MSFRIVDWMARGKRRMEWEQTGSIIAHLLLPHVDKSTQRKLKPQSFMPPDTVEKKIGGGTSPASLRFAVQRDRRQGNVETVPASSVRVVD